MRTTYLRPEFSNKRSSSSVLGSAPLGFKIMFGIVAFFVACTFAFVIGMNVLGNTNQTTSLNCQVIDKHVAVVDGYSQYRVATSNCGTFIIADNLFKGRFDSADAYAQIHEGDRIDVKSVGVRIQVISAFPNMIDFKKSTGGGF